MRAGTLRHRLTIESPVESSDSMGGSTITWNAIGTVWGALSPLSGRELLQAQGVQAETTHRAVMRYMWGVSAKCRIIFGSRVFRITAPPRDTDERHRELILDCIEVASEAIA